MNTEITIELDNDSFNHAGAETARILRELAGKVQANGNDSYGLRDGNGNTVGRAVIRDCETSTKRREMAAAITSIADSVAGIEKREDAVKAVNAAAGLNGLLVKASGESPTEYEYVPGSPSMQAKKPMSKSAGM